MRPGGDDSYLISRQHRLIRDTFARESKGKREGNIVELRVIHEAAVDFVHKCKLCGHSDGEGRCELSVGPVSTSELLAAFVGSPQSRPMSRNYAARIAAKDWFLRRSKPTESGWWETWTRLNEPCNEFRPDIRLG